MQTVHHSNIASKRILILGANVETIPLILKAKEMGIFVIVTDHNPNAPAKKYADLAININGLDVLALVEFIKENNVDGVMVGVADRLVRPYIQICSLLHLPCYGTENQCDILNDKFIFNKSIEKFSLSGIPSYELQEVLLDHQFEKELKFPMFVKPTDGNSGKGMSLCKTVDELLNAVGFAKVHSKKQSYLIERYMDCDDMFLYFTFIEGNVFLSATADRFTHYGQGNVSRVCQYAVYPSKHKDLYLEKYHEKLLQFFSYLKLKNGVLMVSAFVEKDIMYFYDPGFRLQGEAPNIHLDHLLNFNQLEFLISIALNLSSKKINKTVLEQKCATIWILCGLGEIDQIVGLDKVKQFPYVYEISQRLFKGDVISENMIGTEAQVFARIYLQTDSTGININQILNSIKILDNLGVNLVINNQIERKM